MKDDFIFHLPLDVLEKSTDADGKVVMKIGGIASTHAKDTDGEFLDPKGFDLSYFTKQGFFNWHHMSKKDPMAIIGEPTHATIKAEGLYVEGFLYDNSPIAKSVYQTAQVLESSSKNRRLGFSIEGRAIKRRSDDENHPDFKYIEKAAITGCAITFMPKNPKTYMDLIKGGIDDDYQEDDIDDEEVEKMLTAGSTTGTETTNKTDQSGAPLKTESLGKEKDISTANDDISYDANGGKGMILSKSQLLNLTFDKYPGISLKTAEKISNLIIKSFDMDSKEINLKESDVEKALSKIDKAVDMLSKDGEAKTDDDTKKDDVKENDDVEKAGIAADTLIKAGGSKSSVMTGLIKSGYSKELSKSICETKFTPKEGDTDKDLTKSEASDLAKGLADIVALVEDKNHSVGVILKGIYEGMIGMGQRIDTLEKGITTSLEKAVASDELEKGGTSDELQKAIAIFSEVSGKFAGIEEKMHSLEKAMDQPNRRKSVTSQAVARNFQENELNKAQDGNQVSSTNKKVLLEFLDKATFEKGYDPMCADAMLKVENGGSMSPEVRQRLATERGVQVV